MKKELAITHPGSAHFDEITGIGLISAVNPDTLFHIERREPLPADLNAPGVRVVDTGNRLVPEKLNFDHYHSLECPACAGS
jgi:hypothetical protein